MAKEYSIEFAHSVKKDLRKISKVQLSDVLKQIEKLAKNPRPQGAVQLRGSAIENVYRVRFGDYRIIYEIRDEVLVVLILKVGHRRDVYK